jgi:hypothetical protein
VGSGGGSLRRAARGAGGAADAAQAGALTCAAIFGATTGGLAGAGRAAAGLPARRFRRGGLGRARRLGARLSAEPRAAASRRRLARGFAGAAGAAGFAARASARGPGRLPAAAD